MHLPVTFYETFLSAHFDKQLPRKNTMPPMIKLGGHKPFRLTPDIQGAIHRQTVLPSPTFTYTPTQHCRRNQVKIVIPSIATFNCPEYIGNSDCRSSRIGGYPGKRDIISCRLPKQIASERLRK